MNNKIYELKVSVYLNKPLKLKNTYEEIGNFINYSMEGSTYLAELHKQKKIFKHYCFSGLYNIESDKIYKEETIYTFMIRSYKQEIINNLQVCLNGLDNDVFTVIEIERVQYSKSNINYIDTLTPVVITNKDTCKSWNILKDDIKYFNTAIFNNLVKKYNSLEGISQQFNYNDIITNMEIKNKYAIVISYKGVKFLGYKVRIYFKDNSIAQELANLCVAEGIGEKNSSFGQGFCKPYFRKKVR
ncbi:TPA: hypothetical protein LA460_000332 [Clostridium botulinum]|nr:hypothetical protein [Clostridium botulinum]HBJ1652936.1 hypothetical protein [Clostridium botulinum]